jgi:hypothetical protein
MTVQPDIRDVKIKSFVSSVEKNLTSSVLEVPGYYMTALGDIGSNAGGQAVKPLVHF